MKQRICALLAAAVVCGGLLAGCRDNASSPASSGESAAPEPADLRVSFYYKEDVRRDAWLNALAQFPGADAGFTVTPFYGVEHLWPEWTTQSLPSGHAGDLILISGSLAAQCAGGLTDLQEYADLLPLDQYPQEVLAACTADGRLTALPLSTGGRVWLWNAELFAQAGLEPPRTADELLAAGPVFREVLGENVYPLALTASDRMQLAVCWLQSRYGRPFVENGAVSYSADQLAEGLDFLQQLEAEHVTASFPAQDTAEADTLTAAGHWVLETDLSLYDEALWQTGAALALGGAAGGYTTDVTLALAIPAVSGHPGEAARVLAWLVSGEGASVLGDSCGVPAIRGSTAAVNSRLQEAHSAAASLADMPAEPLLGHLDLTGTGGTYEQVLSGLSYGDYTLQEAAAWLIQDMDRILDGTQQ